MILEKRKSIILTVVILSIAMILANILYASTVSFVPLKVENFSPDKSDDVDTQYKNGLDDLKEDPNSYSDDTISDFQYDPSSMKIREDNKVEFVVKRDGLEFTPEMNQLFKEYDVEIYKEYHSINAYVVYISLDSIEKFIHDTESTPGIAYAEPNFYDKISFIPNDDYYICGPGIAYAEPLSFIPNDPYYWDYQWAPYLIGMEEAWDYQLGSHDVLVAVLDTGIDYYHPDLIQNYIPIGKDWINGDDYPWDDHIYGYGTLHAGVIGARINNGIGIAGMANVYIMAEKVFDAYGWGDHLHFAQGVYHAVDVGADIISYSGLGDHSITKQLAVDYAIANNVMVIAPMGNDDNSYPYYPAAYDDVIAVGATDQYDQRARVPDCWGSNYGSWIDITAPGVHILSTIPIDMHPDPYAYFYGTAMATHHVSGLAALIMSEDPSLTPDQVFDIIKVNAYDRGYPGWDVEYGWGVIDAYYMFPLNNAPNAPSNPSPPDGATNVVLNPTLSVIVTDPDDDAMDVSFYDASDDSLIGTDFGITSGGTASTTWSGLSENTTYSWYAVANDGSLSTTSPTWSFTTNTTNTTIFSYWTFLVYLDADNDLESAGIDDFLEMSSVGSDANINIVIQFDRISGYDPTYGDWTTTKRFYITNGMTPTSSNALADLGELNMGSQATLSDFITWGTTNYPGDHYALILWDHGSGWKSFKEESKDTIKAVCYDETSSGDSLTLEELEAALSVAGVHIDLLGFDACLMAMAEVDYQIKDGADVRVGSEEVEPGDGWPYNTILTDLKSTPTMSPTTLGQIIVNRYIQSYPGATIETQSSVDLTLENTLASAIDNFAQVLINGINLYRIEIGAARAASDYSFYKPDYIDLYDFAYEIDNRISNIPIQNAAQDVMNIISTMVIAEQHGTSHPDFHGTTIYFPSTSGGYDSDYELILDFTADLLWDEFLQAYLGIINAPNEPSNPSPPDGATNVVESPILSVIVTEPDGDAMSVSFYDASDDSLIGIDSGIPSGGTASTTWFGLSDDTTYSWYAVANDGLLSNTSSTWSFTTDFIDDPIHIDGDEGWEWASTQPWCSGFGIWSDPYVIQDLIIDAGGLGSGLLIENSNASFMIANCEIYNAISGIELSNTNNGIISGNTVNKNQIGIYLHSSDNNTVLGNTAAYNEFHGILLQDGKNNTLSGNTAHHNWIGIFLSYSNNNTISGNIVYFNWIGVVLQNSNNNNVSGNVAMYIHGYGIRLIGSNNNIISENTVAYISEYAIHLNYSSYNIGTGNILSKTGSGPYYEDSKCYGNDIGYSE